MHKFNIFSVIQLFGTLGYFKQLLINNLEHFGKAAFLHKIGWSILVFLLTITTIISYISNSALFFVGSLAVKFIVTPVNLLVLLVLEKINLAHCEHWYYFVDKINIH